MIYRLSFRDESVPTGGAVIPGRLERLVPGGGWDARPAVLFDLQRERRVIFLLHGFNVNLEEGRVSLGRLAGMLPRNANAALVATLWPGDHSAGALSYPFEGNDADETAEALESFVRTWLDPGVPLSFVAHSLGCRVALEVGRRLELTAHPVEQVCLFAPAVDDDGLSDVDKWRSGVLRAARVAVLHSTSDWVLKAAYPLGDWLRAVFTLWRDDPGFALGYGGPRRASSEPGAVPGNVLHEAVGSHDVGHGDYLPPSDGAQDPNPKQRSAASYADALMAGAAPRYRE